MNQTLSSANCVFSLLCVLQTIKHLRTAEFKPYVVFVKPPPVERLRESRRNAKVISGRDDKGSAKSFSVSHVSKNNEMFSYCQEKKRFSVSPCQKAGTEKPCA